MLGDADLQLRRSTFELLAIEEERLLDSVGKIVVELE